MFNFRCNYRKTLLSFALVPTLITNGGISSENPINLQQVPQLTHQAQNTFTYWSSLLWQRPKRVNAVRSRFTDRVAQNTSTYRISSLWQRRKRKNTVRSGPNDICAIAPGVVDTYIVWHDRPLFLWHSGKNQNAELIVREEGTNKVVWKQTVNIADQKVLYSAPESLEAGKAYEWQLSGSTNWRTFKVMSTEERQKIATQLQTLDQKLKAAKASPEEIATKKAEYFLDYKVHAIHQVTL